MQQNVRTTITFPEDVYQKLKIAAVMQRKTLSEIVTEMVQDNLPKPKEKKEAESPSTQDVMIVLVQLHMAVNSVCMLEKGK